MPYRLTVNGRVHTVDADPDTPLLWVLRDELQLTGTKFGCGIGACGACTVQLDGAAVRSCSLPVSAAQGRAIRTIDAEPSRELAALQAAWERLNVPQCGYCQSGQLMNAAALLAATPRPTDAQIDAAMAGNLCRCGTYQRIRAGIHDAAQALAGGAPAGGDA